MLKDLERDFREPGAWHRGMPFWAWNGKLSPDELRRQVRLMKQMGLGGFFMHSRVGLATPYLSNEWFECIEACADEAEKQGMLAWLYDEDRWPSGAAGGLVTKDPRWRRRSLVMREFASPRALKWDDDVVAAFTARREGHGARHVRRIPRGERPECIPEGEVILAFAVEVDPLSAKFNGYTYLDTLNPQAVRRFIAVTHEAYRKRMSRRFGKVIPGIFSDEPHHGRRLSTYDVTGDLLGLPWTAGLPAAFRKRYGYDLVPHLVELFLDVDGRPFSPARWHYHDCVTHLFVDSFGRQVGEWCRENGLQFTGHVLYEDTLSLQTAVVGSAMRFYEHMQLPGMDLLTERWRAYTTAKQVASAARQFGRRLRLSETYGCTGWDFPFAGHKALGDWQAALGINLRCQHLAWYTMEAEGKRDYPAAVSWQSPWWQAYPKVEDYFARINAVISRGAEVRDLLVVHPVESTWLMVRLGWLDEPAVKRFDLQLVALEDALLGAHVDFDYGDEEILSRKASVAKNRGKALLKVGKAVYTTVLVPPTVTLRSTTLTLLERFAAAGGRVVFAGVPADHADAQPSDRAAALAARAARAPASGAELIQAIEPARRVSIADAAGNEANAALYLLTEDEDAFVLFVCNTGLEGAERLRDIFDEPRVVERRVAYPLVLVRLLEKTAGRPVELDPDTGATWNTEAAQDAEGRWTVSTSLPVLGSRLFVFPKERQPKAPPRRPRLMDGQRVELDGERWEVLLSEDNVLPLDRPRLRLGDGEWEEPEEVLRVDRKVRAAIGEPARGGQMVQPWCRPVSRKPKTIRVGLSYRFEIDTVPTGDVHLCVEQPRRWNITVNGHLLSPDIECGWWVDPSMRRIALDPALLREGMNEVALEGDYDETHPGLEIVYLLGRFGTAVDGTDVRVTEEPRNLSLGDWVPRGLAFYAGSVAYRRKVRLTHLPGERLFLQVPDYRGVAVRVVVNGRTAGIIAWEPNEADITECLPEGTSEADIRVEVLGHRRNSHGPLHHAKKWPVWTGPAEFVTEGADWTDEYQLVPCGLMKPPIVLTRKPTREGAE
jgi:hypothetical protein